MGKKLTVKRKLSLNRQDVQNLTEEQKKAINGGLNEADMTSATNCGCTVSKECISNTCTSGNICKQTTALTVTTTTFA